MVFRKILSVIFDAVNFLPYNARNEITFAKHFIANISHILILVVVNAYDYQAIIRQQILSKSNPGINHIQPIGMETTVTLGVLYHTIAVLIKLPTIGKVFICTLSKVILVNKVIAGVVRRIYKDVIFDTGPVAGKVYKNSENRRKQGVSCGFRCSCRYSISLTSSHPERGCSRCRSS